MEIIKINLTKDKVEKLIEKAESTPMPFFIPSMENNKKVTDFIDALSKRIEIKQALVQNRRLLAGNQGMTRAISTFFIDKGIKTCFELAIEDANVTLCYNEEHNAIELWWLEVQSKGKGTGSNIMTHLLDTVDQLGTKLYLTPVPFDAKKCGTNKDNHNAYISLRNWYESFEGFQRIKNSPSLIYA